MIASGEAPVRVPMPGPLEGRVHLGPFPSARDALKFVAYAAAGAGVAAATNALAWLPFLGAGFVIAVYQPDGRPVDERFGDLVRYAWRSRHPSRRSASAGARPSQTTALTADGLLVGMFQVGGIPLTYRPPEEARRLYDGFRTLLRVAAPGIFVHITVDPMSADDYRPPTLAGGLLAEGESRARSGYSQFIQLVCRRRQRRVVYLLVWEPVGPSEPGHRLNARMASVGSALDGLGLTWSRLSGVGLRRAMERLGWSERLGGIHDGPRPIRR